MARKIRKNNVEEGLSDFAQNPPPTEAAKIKSKLKKENLLSTGNTMLNLSCSDLPDGGLLGGKYYLFVGQSGSGKTWVSYSLFAESGLHPKFKNHKLIFDDVEGGANMDVASYFGKKTAKRVGPPEPGRTVGKKKKTPQDCSKTIEQFYDSLDRHLEEAEEAGTGIIYILDSMDSLTTDAAIKKEKEDKNARKAGKEASGSYGDGKAKKNAQGLNSIAKRLEKTNSILVIICQEKVDITSAFKAKTFSGGAALTFYATLQIWFQVRKKIEVTIEGKKRDLGTLTFVKIEKNRLTGKRHREILFPIYYNFGIDDIGAQVTWLVDEGRWTGGETEMKKINADEFDVAYSKETLIRHIQDNNLEGDLRGIVFKKWKKIQKAIENKVVRKPRYE